VEQMAGLIFAVQSTGGVVELGDVDELDHRSELRVTREGGFVQIHVVQSCPMQCVRRM
jgi:hypothetical protein